VATAVYWVPFERSPLPIVIDQENGEAEPENVEVVDVLAGLPVAVAPR
jgi:hypothetical protein